MMTSSVCLVRNGSACPDRDSPSTPQGHRVTPLMCVWLNACGARSHLHKCLLFCVVALTGQAGLFLEEEDTSTRTHTHTHAHTHTHTHMFFCFLLSQASWMTVGNVSRSYFTPEISEIVFCISFLLNPFYLCKFFPHDKQANLPFKFDLL